MGRRTGWVDDVERFLTHASIKLLIEEKELHLRKGSQLQLLVRYYVKADNHIYFFDTMAKPFRPLDQSVNESLQNKDTKLN